MTQKFSWLAPALALLLLVTGCKKDNQAETTATAPETPALPKAPAFNADSAYAYTAKQVAFGPRVPNSKAHVATGNWIVDKFKSFGLSVREQPFEAMAFDGKMLRSRNIIAQFNPQAGRRVAVFAHWDTRPFADKDKENKNAPLDGASDGASGVGIALEMARQLSMQPDSLEPNVGVDFILFDSEDYGYDESTQSDLKNRITDGTDSWCLGSQYWAKNKVPANYNPSFGILLDMVGAQNAKFSREELSVQNAKDVVDKVWNNASNLGYSDYFLFQSAPGIDDDHVYTNQAGVRTIDIIDHLPVGDEYFPAYHHTTLDNMDIIDKRTLKAVGQTVLTTIYGE
ncbi:MULTISPECIES: M28 family peptidase [Hymenobacter]|uniref:M28 family peptidase n=2 Tax=Hymenobacter TaxID=89966 RepID=A0ABS6WVS7_9BACT|nr:MULTISPECIES: M28 family peptidase [Hymenobacter]MBO3269926.1 M28 family peptidase [Hymenobacter defluvii]MBW3127367.1 M28 family peptidase [Hymenobacter profundi]